MRFPGVWERPPILLFLLLIYLSLWGTGSIQVKMKNSLIKVLMDEDVFIPCMIISNIDKALDLKLLSVRWIVKTLHGSEQDVYQFITWSHNATRPGTYILDSDLLWGNAGLHIPQIHLSDEGEYTCIVFYTPHKVEGRSHLVVSAKPSISLLYHDSPDGPGRNKIIRCQVWRFYPKEIRVQWVKQMRDLGKVVLDDGIHSDQLISNSDGTFNVTNQLEVPGASVGNVYSCIISHRSLELDLVLNYTVSYIEPERRSHYTALWGSLVAIVAIIIVWLVVSAHFKKEPLQISPITGIENLVHKSKATLTCHIYGFSPKFIGITLLLKRKDQDPMEIYSWEYDTHTESFVSVSQNLNGQQVLVSNGENNLLQEMRPIRVEMNLLTTTSKNGNSNCQCTIHITPDIEKDNGAELTVMVTHSALNTPVSTSCQLEVRGAPPQLTSIVCPSHISHGETVALTCTIMGFKPEYLTITWLKVDSRGEITDVETWAPGKTPSKGAKYSHQVLMRWHEGDCTNSISSTLTIKATWHDDNEARYVCRVLHYATGREAEESMKMLVSAPSEGEIQCDFGVHECEHPTEFSEKPRLSKIVSPTLIIHGEYLTLTCAITGFRLNQLEITWLKEDRKGERKKLVSWPTDTISNSKYSHKLQEREHEHFYNIYLSILTMKPRLEEDHEATYICSTYHSETASRAEESMKMLVLAVPKLDPIEAPQETLSIGEKIVLTCRIHSFYPEPWRVSWYKEDEELPSNNDPILTDENGLLCCTSCITYSPCVHDICKLFRCEVTHKSLEKPESVFWGPKYLIGEPSVSDIKCHPEVPECNQPMYLSCTIRDFFPEFCLIQWYRGLKVISPAHYTKVTHQDPKSGLFSVTTEMPFTPTNAHHEKKFCLEISHGKKVFKKAFCLELKGLVQVKDITCNVDIPRYGEPLTLRCEVTQCNPQDFTAEWRESDHPIKRLMKSETQTDRDSVSFLLTLTPTAEHYDKLFTCLVKHKDLPEQIEKNITLKLPDVPPTVSEILVSSERIELNKEIYFTINISGFSPKVLNVKWFKSFIPLATKIHTLEPHIGKNGLYYCSSQLRYTPTETDLNMSIRCEVTANGKRETRQRQLHLGEPTAPITKGVDLE